MPLVIITVAAQVVASAPVLRIIVWAAHIMTIQRVVLVIVAAAYV